MAVLFSDIAGYTQISAALDPFELQRVLNGLYSEYDVLVDRHGLFRLEIVGDAYIVVANLHEQYPDYMVRLALFAQDMARTASSVHFQSANGDRLPVRLRIGIHAGPVVATVLGSDRPRFTLVGDTMNTASRMESTSIPGRIQMSAVAAALLRAQSLELSKSLEPRGELDIKGKGRMLTFFLKVGGRSVCPAPWPCMEDRPAPFLGGRRRSRAWSTKPLARTPRHSSRQRRCPPSAPRPRSRS